MRLFFDTFDGATEVRDEVGLEMQREDVQNEAFAALPELASNVVGGSPRQYWVKVRDETGEYVFIASLSLHYKWVI